jgi:antitoxin CptB
MSAAWADDAATAGRLLWRCRRGMKELDILLERFARKRFASGAAATPAATASVEAIERNTFARFLELPDPLLADYLIGGSVPPEPEFAALARSIIGVPP